MAKRKTTDDDFAQRLRQGADAEQRLLKRERRAERELAELREALAKDEARLERARERLARRTAEVAAAEARLRLRQEERAAGPAAPEPAADPGEQNGQPAEPTAAAATATGPTPPSGESADAPLAAGPAIAAHGGPANEAPPRSEMRPRPPDGAAELDGADGDAKIAPESAAPRRASQRAGQAPSVRAVESPA